MTTGLLKGRPEWMLRAACRGIPDPDVFFPERGTASRAARDICDRCPVRNECLKYALDNDERYGIWSGRSAFTMRARRSA